MAGVAQPLEQHHLRGHDLRAVLAGAVDGSRPVGRVARAGRVRRPHHPAVGVEQVEHRLQDAYVRLDPGHHDLPLGGQQRGEAGITGRRERRLGQDRLRVAGQRRHGPAQAGRVLLGGADRHVRQRRRLREPHGPGHDDLVIGDDGHEPLLQVDQQQDGTVGTEHHFPDGTSPRPMRPEMSVVRWKMRADTKSARVMESRQMAAGDTQITIAGNLVDDPELRFTPSGQPVAKFRVASTPRFRDNSTGEWKDGDSLFLTCNVWRQAAENVAESLTRGMRVIVSGRLRQRSYETKEGEKRTVYEVEVDDVGPSLRNASAKVNRVARSGGDGGYSGGQGGGQRGSGGSGGRSSGGQGGQGGGSAGGADTDPWASDGPGSYTDEPPF